MHCKKYLFFMLFFLILLFPLYGGVLDYFCPPLKGVIVQEQAPQFTLSGALDGSYQTDAGTFFEQSMPGKNALLRLRGETIYSLLRTSPNNYVLRGKDDYLFEIEYLQDYFQMTPPVSREKTDALSVQLQNLQKKLTQAGKELYIYITPSKTRFFPDKAPRTSVLAGKKTRDTDSYENLLASLKNTDLQVFDGVSYLQQNEGTMQSPLFYASGIHWSRVWAAKATAAFNEYMRQTSGYDLAQVTVGEVPTEKPTAQDADLYDMCNLISAPKEQYYDPTLSFTPGSEQPKVLIQGGSFSFGLWNTLGYTGEFAKTDYLENTLHQSYTAETQEFTNQTITSFDDMKLEQYVEDADIVILEVNEMRIDEMSFGLLDYLEQNWSPS
ncbi:MAG: hypothetical protein RR415_10765 [Ruthenibacterium sp.]